MHVAFNGQVCNPANHNIILSNYHGIIKKMLNGIIKAVCCAGCFALQKVHEQQVPCIRISPQRTQDALALDVLLFSSDAGDGAS